MRFLVFWKIGSHLDTNKLAKVSAEMMEKDLFPTKGVEVQEWLICPGGKGITLLEADSEKSAFRAYAVWANAMPGFFEEYEFYPVLEISEAISAAMD